MVSVRRAKLSDIDELVKLEVILFNPPFTSKDLYYELTENPYSTTYVLMDEKIIGMGILWLMFEQSQIVQIGVLPEYRNQGNGKRLLAKFIRVACKAGCEVMSLEVRNSNSIAFDFYQKHGFKQVATRYNYYNNPKEDARLMMRTLI